jgi:hypothetical protein
MAGLAARSTAMGDGRMVRERATLVTTTQVSGAGSEGARRSWRWKERHSATARQACAEKGGGRMSSHARATQVAAMQVSGAGSEDARCDRGTVSAIKL